MAVSAADLSPMTPLTDRIVLVSSFRGASKRSAAAPVCSSIRWADWLDPWLTAPSAARTGSCSNWPRAVPAVERSEREAASLPLLRTTLEGVTCYAIGVL